MEEDVKVPRDLFYTNDHSWVLVDGNIGTIGITDFGQQELAEIVYMDLPDTGSEIAQGSPFGTVEAMKTVAELISPVSGRVEEVNDLIESDPRLINMDPYGEGWLVKVSLHEPDEVDGLLTPEDYLVYITGEDED